jgi:1-deoxy-D-xylulose-5-phosphate synthase
VPASVPALRSLGPAEGPGRVDELAEPARPSRAAPRPTAVDRLPDAALPEVSDVLLVTVGAFGELGVQAAERLTAQGIGVTVVDPRWVKPLDEALVDLAREHRLVVTIEDNGIIGGVGAVFLQQLAAARVTTPVRIHGIPQEFLDHAKRAKILERIGLTPQAIALGVVEELAEQEPVDARA